jgi:hypothetical protein
LAPLILLVSSFCLRKTGKRDGKKGGKLKQRYTVQALTVFGFCGINGYGIPAYRASVRDSSLLRFNA